MRGRTRAAAGQLVSESERLAPEAELLSAVEELLFPAAAHPQV
jgi:hypothetical protein